MRKHIDRGALEHRLSVIGIPPHLIPQLVDIWCKWVTHNGPEWASRRFKSLKTDLIRAQAGLPCQTPYVRKNRKGAYHGAIGALFRWAMSSEKKFSRTLQAMCIYSSVISEELTAAQTKKFIDAVSCEAPIGLDHRDLSEIMMVSSATVGNWTVPKCDVRLTTYRGSSEKIAPLPHDLGYCPQDRKILLETTWLRSPQNVRFYMQYRSLYDPVLEGIGHVTNYVPVNIDPVSYAGEVHFIQEPGFKLRSVASPYRIHQLALLPLKNALKRVVKSLPWDCTHDQLKGVPNIQAALAAGRTVHSVDLTSATDYFPLDLQYLVLVSIFGKIPDVELFRSVSRLTWKSELGDVIWKRGQPLGLNPSFFAFTLTHGVLLNWLLRKEWEGEYYVLGDDIIILDDALHERYISTLKRLGCPYSTEKSLTSAKLAEFAGKVITPNHVYPQLKWRKMSNDNFMDLAGLLGPKSRSLMTRRQQRVFDALKHLMPPIGLNMSKSGPGEADAYAKAFLATCDILDKVQHTAMRSLVDLIRPATRNAMDDPSGQVLQLDTATFDEKVRMVFQRTVFSHWKWLEQVSEIPQALGLSPRLPIEAVPGRCEAIQVYERILDRVVK